MIARPVEPFAELQAAFTVLTKNFSIAAIPAVSTLICFALFGVLLTATVGAAALSGWATGNMFSNPAAWSAMIGGGLLSFGIGALVAILISTISHGAVIAASEAAWVGQAPDLGSAVGRAFGRVGDLLVAGLVLGIIALCIFWTIVGVPLLIFFMLYVGPAVVIGGESAFAAMGTSYRLATANAGLTFAALVGILIAAVVGAIVNTVLGHIPVLGWIAALIVSGLVGAYIGLIVVRFYDLVRGAGTPTVASAPPAAPPPPPAPIS